MKHRDQMFDLPLGLMPSSGQNFQVVVSRQVRREQANRCQSQRAIRQQLQDSRKPARCACGFNAAVRGVLRQMKHARAISEERRASFTEIETARVDFHQRRDQLHGRLPLPGREALPLRKSVLGSIAARKIE
jgi:hypothetical protein